MDEEQHAAQTIQSVHVYPEFGPEHRFEHFCWCRPDYELHPAGVIVVHNVMH